MPQTAEMLNERLILGFPSQCSMLTFRCYVLPAPPPVGLRPEMDWPQPLAMWLPVVWSGCSAPLQLEMLLGGYRAG